MSLEIEIKRIADGIENLVKILSQGNEQPTEVKPVPIEEPIIVTPPAPKKRAPVKKKEPVVEAEQYELPMPVSVPKGVEIPVAEDIIVVDDVPEEALPTEITEQDVRVVAKKLISMHKDISVGQTQVIEVLMKVAKTDKIFKLVPSQYEAVIKALEEKIDANI